MNLNEVDRIFRRGLEDFNQGRFFEAHEAWEEVWLRTKEPEKSFLQGIIQVAAAFHHYSRGNFAGAQSLLVAGLTKLEHFPAVYRGLALEKLRSSARWWITELSADRAPGDQAWPRIEQALGS